MPYQQILPKPKKGKRIQVNMEKVIETKKAGLFSGAAIKL